MTYRLKIVTLFLFCFGFSRTDLCQNKFVVQNCTDSSKFQPNINAFVYDLFEQPTSLLCPQTRTINGNDITPVPEWRVMSSSSGNFCTTANYSVQEICVVENENSTLVIDEKFFANIAMGEETIDFVHNATVSRRLILRYADVGVHPHMNFTDITATEGDANVSFAYGIYIEKEKLADPNVKESLYHIRNDIKTPPINVRVDISPPKFTLCNIADPTSCQCTKDKEFAHVYTVTLRNVTTANDGIYLLEVITGSRNFSASISLSVTPSPITSTSTTIISSTSTTPSSSQTTSPSPSQSSPSTPIVTSPPTDSNTTSVLPVVYIAIGILLGVVVIVVIIIIIMLVVLKLYKNKKNRNTPGNNMEDGIALKNGDHPVGNGHGPPPINNPPRTSSVSSERPLVNSASSSNVSTPTTKAPSDYTAVYCDKEHRNIGKMWRDKYDDAIHIMEDIEDIIDALPNHHCIEILVYAELTDELSRELLSRGILSDRSKLKWWQFVDKDRTPDNTIEINGFKVIQVEGDPNDFDTHQLGILKSEYPVLQRSTQGPKKQRKHFRELEETDYPQGSPQTIHHPPPVQTSTPQAKLEDNGEVVGILKEYKDILQKIADNTEKGTDLQKQHLEVSKETRDLQQEGNDIASAQLAHQEATDVGLEEEEKSPEDSVV